MGNIFGWNLTISHKIWEIWEDEDLWLAETGGDLTFEWNLTENEMTMSFQKEVTTPQEKKQLCIKPSGFLVTFETFYFTKHFIGKLGILHNFISLE